VSGKADEDKLEDEKMTKAKAGGSSNSTTPDEKLAGVSEQDEKKQPESAPFALRDIDISIPRGERSLPVILYLADRHRGSGLYCRSSWLRKVGPFYGHD
jgi:hypothetical protein